MRVLPGDFCCVPVSGIVGKLISVGEWLNGDGFSKYDHAEIYVGNQVPDMSPSKYGYTFGAYPGGATYTPLSCPPEKLPNALWSSGRIELTDAQRSKIVSTCHDLEGTPYSAADYFALAEHRFHLPIPLLKNYVASSKHQICSQIVDYIYMKAGKNLFSDNRWPGYVTPADLAHVLEG